MVRDYIPSGLMKVDLADPIVVIPIIPIDNNVTVLDVTDFSSNDRDNILHDINEYHEYIKTIQKTILSYEDWNTQACRTPIKNLKQLIVSRTIVSKMNSS